MELNKKLSKPQQFYYSLGHFYNDLCSAMWFSYLLVYLNKVANISESNAGVLLLLGQVTDAIFTPFIGYESDRNALFVKNPKRKSWHLFGTISVACSFTFLFMPVLGGSRAADFAKLIYYMPFVVIFQIGWSAVQVSHMSLVADLTFDASERVSLNSYRNAMTLVANVFVYVLIWIIFQKSHDNQWSPLDSNQFIILGLSLTMIGLISSIIFHVFLIEKPLEKENKENNENSSKQMIWKDWFKEATFYIVAFTYVGARLINNISQTYWSFYIIDSLQLSKSYVATIPLVVYISGFIISFPIRHMVEVAGKNIIYLCGVILLGLSFLWIEFITQLNAYQIFGPAIIIGMGNSIINVTSLSMIADMIDTNTETSAFVLGMMSFMDKLVSGIVIMVIQLFQPSCETSCPVLSVFYKGVMTYFLSAVNLLCLVLIFVFQIYTLRKKRTA